MTRKILLIAGVAVLAISAPAAAQKEGRGDKPQRSEARQDGDQRAERPQRQERQERPQAERAEREAERPQRIERQQQRLERQAERAERPQRIEREQRIERPQRAERQQQRIERQVERAERPRRFERQQRIERQIERAERPRQIERQQQRLERSQRAERRQQRIERQVERAERQQRIERQADRIDRPRRLERQEKRIERQAQRFERDAKIGQRDERRDLIRGARQAERQQQRFERQSAERLFAPRIERDGGDVVRTARFDGRGYRPVAPIFATREMRQMEPFRAKFDDSQIVSIGERFDNSRDWSPVPAIYGSRYVDNGDYYYRYDNDLGYAYQVNRQTNIVSSLFPLFGGYGIGDPWPQTYYSSYVPVGYRDYYYDTPDYYYRNDGYGIYQVDVGTQLITALVSLVMGQSFGIGQTLPASYGAYNVPLSYRANYADSDDSWYRYGDGFIYEVDPYSRRVEQRYPLYSEVYYVGERWPVAYPDYNVPYGYRSAYEDSPQYHYRFANGGIYQVDPTSQIILALAALVTGDQFAVGQPMPVGYDIYNVPVDYRDRWADSDDEYYRYANGYVYRVDDDSGLIEEAFPVYA